MSIRTLQQAIALIQSGDNVEGARLMRLALQSDELQPAERAMGLMWLASTTNDLGEQIAIYRQAVELQPNDNRIRERLNKLLRAAQPPSMPDDRGSGSAGGVGPPPSMPDQPPGPAPVNPGTWVVRISGGSNNIGSGFFLRRDGLIVTTRFVVGAQPEVGVTINRHQLRGQVLRSFPQYDVALIGVNAQPQQMLQPATDLLEPGMPLMVLFHDGEPLYNQHRVTQNQEPSGWITTMIKLSDMRGAGGGPILNPSSRRLIGMITRNTRRSNSFVYGIHISVINHCLQQFDRERQQSSQRSYCQSCGAAPRALALGAFYCDTCGSTLPEALNTTRYPQPDKAGLYGETSSRGCTNCGSHAGMYNSRCLRCGADFMTGQY